jgi:GntR family transcriptional regulator
MAALPFHDAIPLYHQISQVLRLRAAGSEQGGLATEQALCAEFGVSRTTIRQALAALKRDGLLQSRRGVGTRIVRPRAARTYTRSSGDPLHAGLGSEPRIVSFGMALPPAAAAEFLGLTPGKPALEIVRTHQLDRTPLSVVASWLPPEYAARITAAALRRATLHEVLWRRFGALQKKSVHTIRVARADARIAALLGTTIADPVLYIQSSVRLADGRPVRWTENWFHEDRYQYTAEMAWKKPSTGPAAHAPARRRKR